MRLYYMTSPDIGELILKDRRMKLSLYNELNDPFELLAHALGDKLMRKAHKTLKEHFVKTKGVICFSANWSSPVMWAHYAQKHFGVCLGFDVPMHDANGDEFVYPMNYEPERLKFEYDKEKWTQGEGISFVRGITTTKAKAWEYEREWRATADLKEQDPATGFYFVPFSETLQLREVILGARHKSSVGAVAKLVAHQGSPAAPVQVLRARVAHQTFSIVRNKEVTPINVKAAK